MFPWGALKATISSNGTCKVILLLLVLARGYEVIVGPFNQSILRSLWGLDKAKEVDMYYQWKGIYIYDNCCFS